MTTDDEKRQNGNVIAKMIGRPDLMERTPLTPTNMIDVRDITTLGITISDDHTKVWINLPEGCVLRAQNVQTLVLSIGPDDHYYNQRKPTVKTIGDEQIVTAIQREFVQDHPVRIGSLLKVINSDYQLEGNSRLQNSRLRQVGVDLAQCKVKIIDDVACFVRE